MSSQGFTEPPHRLRTATALLRQRRHEEAAAELRRVIAEAPGEAEAHHLLGVALMPTGDLDGAEAAFADALAADPRLGPAAAALSEIMLADGRGQAAAALLAPIAGAPGADLGVMTAYASVLKLIGRLDEAVDAYEATARAWPQSAVAEHNLAAVLGDVQHFAPALAATDRASAKGLHAPETWLVRARALQGLGRLDDAEAAYRAAIVRRPAFADARNDLAQLIWMRTEDIAAACAPLEEGIADGPGDPGLPLAKARLQEYAGDLAGADATLAAAAPRHPQSARLQITAARIATFVDPQRALAQAQTAAEVFAYDPEALSVLCQAQLAIGEADAAAATGEALHARDPLDQGAIALLVTARRLQGDPGYGALYDYQSLVSPQIIDTPDGWDSLDAYLADLARALRGRHAFRGHPVGQSLRGGSQTPQDLRQIDDPAVQALFQALDGPIRRHIAALGAGDDPVRSRITGGYAFEGVWSARLRPKGFHVDHVHPRGWLSSACYIDLPDAVRQGREGWLKFGEPGVATRPVLGPEHFIQPQPGMLVLFPSYMWHGTVPFSGAQERLAVAFDLLPG